MRYVTQLLTGPMTNLPAVQTPRIPVTTRYHGVDVTEDYQWLEDALLSRRPSPGRRRSRS